MSTLEYAGEMMYDAEYTRQCVLPAFMPRFLPDLSYHRVVNKYTGRNYVFSCAIAGGSDENGEETDPVVIDAAVVGNAARYLNHAPAARANVYAECSCPLRSSLRAAASHAYIIDQVGTSMVI